MSTTFPNSVLPGRSVYHKVYGSSNGGAYPQWEYWKICPGWYPPVPVTRLVTVEQAVATGLRPCAKCYKGTL